MSNLIKYPYVNMQGKEAKVICYESEEEKFQPLDAKKKVVMKTFEEVAKEEKERAQEETGDESFQEGLPVTNYDEVIEEKIQKAEEEAEAAIAEARQQANEIVEQAKKDGFVTTLMGRRRYLPELQSKNYNLRSFGERCAMNSPIQGTAADIIKLAMIRVADALRKGGYKARLILQVHDELIVEAPEDEQERVRALLKDCMEGVAALAVPLKTDISVGRDWRECK